MRLKLSSLAGVLALVVSTTAGAQDITKKPVTGADRKKTTAPAAAKPTATTDSTTSPDNASSPGVVTSPTVVQPTETTPVTTPDEPAAPQSTAPGQTGNTPGQTQASPGQASEITPAETGTTPSGQSVPTEKAQSEAGGQVTAATAADVKAGVSVFDQKGGVVGKVDSVSGKNAVVSTGTVKASVPVSSFAKNDKGLVISMTKAEIDAQAKTSTKTPPTKKPK
jgi:hypothetical protein